MGHFLSRLQRRLLEAPPGWLLPALLVLSVPQAPLFSKNQTTKFLHGAASAGYGHLTADWTANTLDPLPVFSALVRALFALDATWLAYPAFAGLVFIYGVALVRIARRHFPALREPGAFLVFTALFLFFNKTTTPLSMENAFAGQYLLGGYLQPCVFGAFLLLGLERGLAGRFVQASASLALATAMHSIYLLAAVLLFAALAVLAWRQGQGARALLLGGLVFWSVVLGLGIHHAGVFGPTDPATWQQAVALLARERIPHHTDVGRWFDVSDALRAAVMVAGIALVRRRPLAWVLGALFVPMAVSIAVLSVVSIDWLALTTPWRLSVVILPVCATLLAAALACRLVPPSASIRARTLARNLSLVLIAAALVWGAARQVRLVKRHYRTPEMEVIAFARSRAEPGQTYLVPPAESKLNPFRLHSGVPIVVNRKNHPYKDTEVLEWHRRVTDAQSFYDGRGEAAWRSLDRLRALYGVTHAVVPASGWQAWQGWQPVFRNREYVVLAHTP